MALSFPAPAPPGVFLGREGEVDVSHSGELCLPQGHELQLCCWGLFHRGKEAKTSTAEFSLRLQRWCRVGCDFYIITPGLLCILLQKLSASGSFPW